MVGAATGAMGSLLLKLGSLLREEYKLQTGVKEDIRYLERELRSMHAALRKVGGIPRDQLDEQVKLWADEVRDLSYRMEDVVDKFLVRVEATTIVGVPKLKRLMEKMGDLFTKGKIRHDLGEQIKDIKVRIQEAAGRRDRYKVNEVVSNPPGATVGMATADPRLLALYKDRKDLVGIDVALSYLTKVLTDEDKELKILTIVGFGGLGKTTLAKAVYDKLQSSYDCSAFVPVGQNPSVRKLLMDILFGINKKIYRDSLALDERQLIDKLRELLENKRYFIIIDDIWDMNVWETVRCALTGEVYKLKPLSRDLSKELFNTRLFGGNNKCSHDHPTKVYDKILNKCGGVPLAIITIASLLVGKPVEDWSKVYNLIGFGSEDNKDVENTRKILLFSYYDLPCHLRTCLLYLSIYPEDHFIEKDTIIWKWVAEGFIHEEPEVTLFEIGERYFNQLVNKNMVQPIEKPYNGIIIGCRVHDMVLDMICLLSKEENFVTLLDGNKQYTSSHVNARRLAVGWRSDPLANMCMPQVRSLNATCNVTMMSSLSCFEVLRILDLKCETDSFVWTKIKHLHLQHLGKLVHLRYLGLGDLDICKLPKKIGNLKFLQTLDLSDNDIEKLPKCISQLNQLKCLHAYNSSTKIPNWIGNLTSLEELRINGSKVSPKSLNGLGKLTELRKLRIEGHLWLCSESLENAWVGSLVKLQKIEVIDVETIMSWLDVDDTWEGHVLPRQIIVLHMSYIQPGLVAKINPSLLPNLSHLTIHVGTPNLEIFGRFPKLLTLKLDMPDGRHHDVMGSAGAFPKLRVLKTSATPGQFLEGDMPSLESLQFIFQAQYTEDGKLHDFDLSSLVNLPLLKEVIVGIQEDIYHEFSDEIDKAGRCAVNAHPSHLKFHVKAIGMASWENKNGMVYRRKVPVEVDPSHVAVVLPVPIGGGLVWFVPASQRLRWRDDGGVLVTVVTQVGGRLAWWSRRLVLGCRFEG
ncbi:disease resistance protein Pik-2-like [Triticum dicoccoides]|uniref:disease resistance protein Pik-2-like n=1 Tax=Triticum dicoccoides TaxID=85692 RepID=UPI00188EBF37|nr:disease resistance protein Pik-2-like [Triticum dicoccoides]